MHLILYSKPGCHLCEGLQEKIAQIKSIKIDLEVRDITSRDDWFQSYQYEIPVLFIANPEQISEMQMIPRISPRTSVLQLEKILQRYL